MRQPFETTLQQRNIALLLTILLDVVQGSMHLVTQTPQLFQVILRPVLGRQHDCLTMSIWSCSKHWSGGTPPNASSLCGCISIIPRTFTRLSKQQNAGQAGKNQNKRYAQEALMHGVCIHNSIRKGKTAGFFVQTLSS